MNRPSPMRYIISSASPLFLTWITLAAIGCDPGPELDEGALPESGVSFQATPGAGGAPSNTPVDAFGQLRVEGSQIVNEDGEPIQLKGASSMWLNWETDGFAESLDALVWLRDHWNLSVIRAAMGVEPGGAYLQSPERAKQQVRTIVDNAIEAGVYVIVDWHDHNAHMHEEEAKQFFSELSEAYADVPNIIYETFNEPQQVSWADVLKPYHEEIVAAIRDNDPDNLIVLGTPNWSQYVDEAAINPVEGDNLLYTLHFYSCSHGAAFRQRADKALKAGAAVFVTEWGATDADGGLDGLVCLDEAQNWTDWMRERGISWTAWKLDNCSDSSCYFKSGVPIDGGWTDDDLQGHGPFVRDRMKE